MTSPYFNENTFDAASAADLVSAVRIPVVSDHLHWAASASYCFYDPARS